MAVVVSCAGQCRGVTPAEAWNDWLDAHAAWRKSVADVVQGRTTDLRSAPKPPEAALPLDDSTLALRIAAAMDDLGQLRDQAAHRVGGELHAALAYRTDGAGADVGF